MIPISQRLQTIANYLPPQTRMADIGTDHAYLPCYAIQQGLASYAIASDVVVGPYESARQTVADYQLTTKVDVRLGSGIQTLTADDQIETITISGMGGKLITDILNDREHLFAANTLILQPNMGAHFVRTWLQAHDFVITAETIVYENEKFYEIIVGQKQAEVPVPVLSETEIHFGPHLLAEKSPEFIAFWQQEITKRQYQIAQMQASGSQAALVKATEMQAEIEKIEVVLHG